MTAPETTKSPKFTKDQQFDNNAGVTIVSILLAGIGFYTLAGWAIDRWLGTQWGVPVGAVIGVVLSLYMVMKRYGGQA